MCSNLRLRMRAGSIAAGSVASRAFGRSSLRRSTFGGAFRSAARITAADAAVGSMLRSSVGCSIRLRCWLRHLVAILLVLAAPQHLQFRPCTLCFLRTIIWIDLGYRRRFWRGFLLQNILFKATDIFVVTAPLPLVFCPQDAPLLEPADAIISSRDQSRQHKGRRRGRQRCSCRGRCRRRRPS